MKYNKLLFATCLLFSLDKPVLAQQEDLSVFGYWKYEQGNTGQILYKHLSNTAFGQLDARQNVIEKLVTKADWIKRQSEIRAKLAKAVGPFPEKNPLNPVITGKLKRDGFTVEKLYFESRPGYHVTAAMFIPDKRQEKAPAIIFCSGHSENGFRSEAYQRIMLNYVKKGFIVLAFDPIGQGERIQYVPGELQKSATHEHSYPGAQSFISGIPAANYFIWDGIRSVDYLLTRKEVDPARIGITGRSGGGTQSAYIAAMDDRILAAAPENYITSFDKLLRSNGPQDAEQNLMHGIKNGIDMSDFLTVRVPKPGLIVATTMDIFSIQGARDAFAETKRAYLAFGKAGDIQMTEDDAGHASTLKNREASYAFFQKYLSNPGSAADEKIEFFTDEELHVTPGGKAIASLKGESMFSLNEKYSTGVLKKREDARKATPTYQKDLINKISAIAGYTKPKGNHPVVFSGRLQRADYAIEKYLIKGGGEYQLPLLWLKPKKASGKTVLLLDDQGKTEALQKGELAEKLVRAGYEVVLPDLSGIGELGNGYLKGGDSMIDKTSLNLWFYGVLTQKSLVAVRAEEIAIVADFVKRSGNAGTSLSAVASGTVTADLLHAASFENPFSKLVMIQPLVSYQSIVSERLYKTKFVLSSVPGALPVYDLPDLVENVAGKGLLLINPVKATDQEMTQDELQKVYQKSEGQKQAGKFATKTGLNGNTIAESVLAWIQ